MQCCRFTFVIIPTLEKCQYNCFLYPNQRLLQLIFRCSWNCLYSQGRKLLSTSERRSVVESSARKARRCVKSARAETEQFASPQQEPETYLLNLGYNHQLLPSSIGHKDLRLEMILCIFLHGFGYQRIDPDRQCGFECHVVGIPTPIRGLDPSVS